MSSFEYSSVRFGVWSSLLCVRTRAPFPRGFVSVSEIKVRVKENKKARILYPCSGSSGERTRSSSAGAPALEKLQQRFSVALHWSPFSVTVACCMSFICSALVIADPVSFICSTLPSTMSDYNDDDDSSKVEELDMDGTSKQGLEVILCAI